MVAGLQDAGTLLNALCVLLKCSSDEVCCSNAYDLYTTSAALLHYNTIAQQHSSSLKASVAMW